MKSNYTGVKYIDGKWMAKLFRNGRKFEKECSSEREAAIAVDRQLLIIGKEPVNILKKKQ